MQMLRELRILSALRDSSTGDYGVWREIMIPMGTELRVKQAMTVLGLECT